LINRIIDRVETPAEWSEFRGRASTEPSSWELLAEAQRDNERMQQLVLAATEFANRVELPAAAESSRSMAFRRSFSSGAGWAVAAAIVIAWIATVPNASNSAPRPVQAAGLAPDADAAWKQYIDQGQTEGVVIGEVQPNVLIDTTPLANGGYEVVFVRQIIERRQVPMLIRPNGHDEHGVAQGAIVRPAFRGAL